MVVHIWWSKGVALGLGLKPTTYVYYPYGSFGWWYSNWAFCNLWDFLPCFFLAHSWFMLFGNTGNWLCSMYLHPGLHFIECKHNFSKYFFFFYITLSWLPETSLKTFLKLQNPITQSLFYNIETINLTNFLIFLLFLKCHFVFIFFIAVSISSSLLQFQIVSNPKILPPTSCLSRIFMSIDR